MSIGIEPCYTRIRMMNEAADTPEPKRALAEYWGVACDLEDRAILSVHIKRTYDLTRKGECARSEVQLPLIQTALLSSDGEPVFRESDLLPVKRGADLVVLGTACGRGRTSLISSIAWRGGAVRYLVLGER